MHYSWGLLLASSLPFAAGQLNESLASFSRFLISQLRVLVARLIGDRFFWCHPQPTANVFYITFGFADSVT